MKRIIIMLLIIGSAVTTASAQQQMQKNVPHNVKALFWMITHDFAVPENQVYSVVKNPNTGLLQSSDKVTHFVAPVKTGSTRLNLSGISEAFMKDEPVSYQIKHIVPGSNSENFTLAVHTYENDKVNHYAIRTKQTQEMWLLCTKNPENPSLRDAYAIVWEPIENGNKVKGAVYMITSPRPSSYDKVFDNSKKVFKIEGRVDANIKDSLYNIYIADSYAALNAVGDDDYVACVPVVNKRFEYQTELDRPMVGRLRCIFPDGELCSAWIDLDFVPGETYHITVHNGYYDSDNDYERRVGRYSGKSLINRTTVVDNTAIEVEDADVVTVDEATLDEVTIGGKKYVKAHPTQIGFKPSPAQMIQVEQKGKAIEANKELIKATYQSLKPYFEAKTLSYTDRIFEEIARQNKELDKKCQDFIAMTKGWDIPLQEKSKVYSGLYQEILKLFTKQNQGFTELYKEFGVLPKSAQKTQKYINKLTEKYVSEMSKLMIQTK